MKNYFRNMTLIEVSKYWVASQTLCWCLGGTLAWTPSSDAIDMSHARSSIIPICELDWTASSFNNKVCRTQIHVRYSSPQWRAWLFDSVLAMTRHPVLSLMCVLLGRMTVAHTRPFRARSRKVLVAVGWFRSAFPWTLNLIVWYRCCAAI